MTTIALLPTVCMDVNEEFANIQDEAVGSFNGNDGEKEEVGASFLRAST